MQLRFASLVGTRVLLCFALFCLPFCLCLRAPAQAAPTQYKTQSLAVFGGYLYDNIDYYPQSGSGVTFGVDFTRHIHFPVQPSLEGRINLAYSTLANEKSYLGGLKGEHRIGRFYPYVDFLVGFGTIHFNNVAPGGYVGDNSTTYSPGAGVDIDVVHNVRLKVDYQHQYWNIGHTAYTEFQPSLFVVGLSYAVPFRPFHRSGEPHY